VGLKQTRPLSKGRRRPEALTAEYAEASHGLSAIAPNDPGLAQKALEWITRLGGVRRAMLLLRDRESGLHRLAASVGLTSKELEDYLQEPWVEDRESLEDTDSKESPLPGLLEALFPETRLLRKDLNEQEVRLGVLLLDVEDIDAPRREACGLLASQLALVLRNAQLVKELSERNRQLATATASLVQSEKLALIGKMAATVANQMRNPLSVIGANVQLLQTKRPAEDPEYSVMQVLLEKVRETNATVHSLLDLARPLALDLRRVDLEDSVRTVVRFVGHRCEAQAIEMRLAVLPGLPQVWADEQQLQRCLLDLCMNAVQAMPGGGRLVVAAAAFGPRVELRVEDNGPGISAGMLQELFEPFCTDKAKGNGLGLYNVKRVCDAMGVEVVAANVEPHGASFRLSFPVGPTRPQPILESVPFGRPQGAEFGTISVEK
jgi:signal transduction histidine kinase